ncbi:tetratricopeptide repeat protein [Leptotrichia sp. HSP-536]|uniref:Tetratricopeptide repeat protein n=1 Tax=Leptotrichia alba TaxID=3239304 RepID=A0AB39V7H4_9FUSO
MKKLILLAIIILSFAVRAGDIENARKYYKNKDFEQAKKYYLKAAQNGDERGYNGLGAIYMEEDNFDEAEQMFLKAGEYGYNGLGGVYMIRKEYDKAQEMYYKALNTALYYSTNPSPIYYNLGVLYYFKQDYDNAKKFIKKAADTGVNKEAEKIYKQMIQLGY